METGQTYHIYNHANGSENIFREEENYRYFMQQYLKHLADVADTFAYCLLPNHFHFLLRVKDIKELKKNPTFEKLDSLDAINKKISKSFANLFISYSMAFNKKYNRMGSVFMKNFKRKPIESLEQWQETFLYIHLNPIKHGFTTNLDDWKWSSWHAYTNPQRESKLNRTETWVYFDDLAHIQYCLNIKRERIMELNLE